MKPKSPFKKPYQETRRNDIGHREGPLVARPAAIAARIDQAPANIQEAVAEGLRSEGLIFLEKRRLMTDADHEACELEAFTAWRERGGMPCDDCAFRPGSPEADLTLSIAQQGQAFRCHQGMPLEYVGGEIKPGLKARYAPRDNTKYPVCNGWAYCQQLEREAECRP